MKAAIILTIIFLFTQLAQLTYGWEPSHSFIEYLKQVEGFSPTVYYIGDKPHIGYGHAIKQGEIYNRLSESSATELLVKDVKAVYGRLNAKYGSELSNRQQEMLADYFFNLGSMTKFPKMEAAILANDLPAMRREYKRYFNGKPLTGRNTAFYNRYLK